MRRLYNAVCALIEAKAAAAREPEPYDGEAAADSERSDDRMPQELHAANMHDSIDNDYGARIGFTGQRVMPNRVPPKIISRNQIPKPPRR